MLPSAVVLRPSMRWRCVSVTIPLRVSNAFGGSSGGRFRQAASDGRFSLDQLPTTGKFVDSQMSHMQETRDFTGC